MTGHVAMEVPVATVILVATTRQVRATCQAVAAPRVGAFWLRSRRPSRYGGIATPRPEGMFSLTSPAAWCIVAELQWLVQCVEWRRGRGKGGHAFVKALVCGLDLRFSVWGTPGWSILAVGLPADVATAEPITTSEKASPRPRGVSEVQGGSAYGTPTLWRYEVVVPVDVGACAVRLWSHMVAPVFRELRCLGGCVPRICFHVVLLWPDPDCGSWCYSSCFRMSSFASALLEFLLLWLVRDWWLAFQQGPSVLLLLLGARAANMVAIFSRAAVGFIVSLRVRVGVSRRLREPACGVAFTGAGLWSVEPVEGVLALLAAPFSLGFVNSGEVLPEFFSVGSGGGLRHAAIVWLLHSGGFSTNDALVVLVECSGDVFPERLLALWVEVLPKLPFFLGFVGQAVVPLAVCLAVVLARIGRLASFSRTLRALLDGGLVVVTYGAVSCCAASSQCVSPLVPQLCLEALVAVWCVALSAYGGRSSASCCALLRANMVVALLKLPVLRMFCMCGSLVKSPFRVRGRCGLFYPFWLAVSCGWLWQHPVLMLEWFVFVLSGDLVHCIALWLALGACVSTVCCAVFLIISIVCSFVALLVVRQALVVACVRFLWLHSRCVSLSDHEDDLVFVSSWDLYLAVGDRLSTSACVLCAIVVCSMSCRMSGLALLLWRGCGVDHREVVVPIVTVNPVATTRCVAFLSRLVNRSRRWYRDAPPRRVFGRSKAKALASSPFPCFGFLLSLLHSEEGKFSLPSPAAWCVVAELRWLVQCVEWRHGRGGGGFVFVKALVWGLDLRFNVWETPGWSIPAVGLPADVATTECVVTSEKASPRARLPIGPSGGNAAGCLPGLSDRREVRRGATVRPDYRGGCRKESVAGMLEPSRVSQPTVVSVTRSLVPSMVAPECVVSLTLWSVRGVGWFYLWALDLVEVRDVGACAMRLWSHVVSPVFLASAWFDFAGYAGVVFGLTRSSFASTLLEFLLHWLVRDWIPRRDLPARSDEPVVTLKRPRRGLPARIDKAVAICVCLLSEWQAWQGDLSGCRGAQVGRVLVAVGAAVALWLVTRRPAPSRFGIRRLKALAGSPFPSFWHFLPFSFSSLRRRGLILLLRWLELGDAGGGSCGAWSGGEERGGGSRGLVKVPLGFGSFNFVVAFVGDHGMWIPSVGLLADVVTTEHIATSEKVSPWFDATLSQHGWPCSFLTSWSVRGAGWFCLWTLNLVELPHVFDSVGSAGVAFGLTQVVVEFLLLWLVRDWLSLLSLVREAHPPTLF
ncbi:hypothetical protein Taro_044065, partial [Colocasia esculenta]|nr:hypothetical protein [Colocasia esculenta]